MSKQKKNAETMVDSSKEDAKEPLISETGTPYAGRAKPAYDEIVRWQAEGVSIRAMCVRLKDEFGIILSRSSLHGWIQRKAKAATRKRSLYTLPPKKAAMHPPAFPPTPSVPSHQPTGTSAATLEKKFKVREE